MQLFIPEWADTAAQTISELESVAQNLQAEDSKKKGKDHQSSSRMHLFKRREYLTLLFRFASVYSPLSRSWSRRFPYTGSFRKRLFIDKTAKFDRRTEGATRDPGPGHATDISCRQQQPHSPRYTRRA
jgi:hypothetical protein